MTLSIAVFGPQSRAPSGPYLDSVRAFMLKHPLLKCIIDDAHTLNDVLFLLSKANGNVATLKNGQRYTDVLVEWLVDGISEPAASIASGIVALPRLAIIQFTQYFQFLANQKLTHAELVLQLRDRGGLQGYCGGLPAAVALSCTTNEQELTESICTAIRLAFAIGLYAELGDDSEVPGVTTAVIRLKQPGQAEELVRIFPHTYISAITDPKSISVVGPIKELAELQAYVIQQGLLVQGMEIRGKTHNPENNDLAVELSTICEASDLLRLPQPSLLQAPLRSNRTGGIITTGSLTAEIVQTVLASRCEWYDVLCNIASDLKRTNFERHGIVSFGIGDCVPLLPFNKLGLQMTKTDWSGQIKEIPKQLNSHLLESWSYPEDAVAVIGTAVRLPGARNMHELWELISNAQDRHEELNRDRFDIHNTFRASQSGSFAKNRKFYGNFLDQIDKFDNAFFGINTREMLNMDPQQRMLLELAYEAMESSGYTHSHVRSHGDNVGCFIGASFVEYLDNTNAYPPTAYTSTGTIRAFLCGRLSYHFGWSGPAEVVDTACSSSLVAVNRAVKSIQTGECGMALTGGINLITGANNFLDLAKAGFLSPTGQCKPFDKNADGYCRAEGAGLVVLKSLKQARIDGNHIMGVIVGSATNQGGLSSSLTIPSSDAQTRLYQSVLAQADMSPDQVTYVEAHGTGTQAGDPLEIASLRAVLGSPLRSTVLQIGSIKGNIGHCETAAGIAGLLKTICMLEHRAIPPQASHKVWNPKIPDLSKDRMAISTKLKEWEAPFRAALVNSYGAAGSNAAVICCEPPKSQRPAMFSTTTKLPVILSARTITSLDKYKKTLVKYLQQVNPQPSISNIAATLSERRQRHKFFELFEASDTTELVQKLTADDARGSPPKLDTPRPVVLVFGGQSKQTIGLNKKFYDHFEKFREALDECDSIVQDLGYSSFLPFIFEATSISDIVVLQTGFVALQYAAAITWVRAGLNVAAVIGHSLGELTALAVSGKLSIRDCLRLVATRASLMKSKWGPEKGSMLALFSDQETVAELLIGSELETACYNSDTSQVVTGTCEAITKFEQFLSSKSPPVKCMKVDTSHGFHSRLVDPVLDDLAQVAATLDWKESKIPFVPCTECSTTSTSPYSPSEHARKPVFFSNAMKRLEQSYGNCIFVEAGFDTPVISMAKRAVARPEIHQFLSLSARNAVNPLDILSRTVCDLWNSSIKVSHWSLMPSIRDTHYVWLPPYQFEDTSAWLDNIDRVVTLQSQLNQRIEPEATRVESPAKIVKMITLLSESTESSKKTRYFRVSVEGIRFRGIISGHAVRNRPLCPASVYLECVTMAISLIADNVNDSCIEFQGLDIQTPLGVGADTVNVVLEEIIARGRWAFKVISRDGKESLHAKGQVTLSQDSKLETIARLVSKRIKTFPDDVNAERMLSRRAYNLFSRVVTYAKFLEGIANITMSDNEALAEIVTPHDQPGVEESSVIKICDSVTMDNFIQVVGLLMNTSDMVGRNEVMVCSGVDSSMIAKGLDMADCRSWKVHATYTPCGPSQALGDVLVFTEHGSVAAAFTGCRFSKLDMSRLERLLDSANQVTSHRAAQPPFQHHSTPQPKLTPIDVGTKSTSRNSNIILADTGVPSPLPTESNLRQILETYTGVAAASISADAVLGDLGLDSLAATEMAEELRSSNSISIEGQDLPYMSVKQLEKKMYGVLIPGSGPSPLAYDSASKDDALLSTAVNKAVSSGVNEALASKLSELLVEMTGVPLSAIKPKVTLDSLGIDSLAMTEINSALSELCPLPLDTDELSVQSTVEEVLHAFAPITENDGTHSSNDNSESELSERRGSNSASSRATSITIPSAEWDETDSKIQRNRPRITIDPAKGLLRSEAEFEAAALSKGFQNYWSDVAVQQDTLTLAYVLEAFDKLGVSFSSMQEGDVVPQVSYLPKHHRVFQRFQDILAKHGIVKVKGEGIMTRGDRPAKTALSSQLHEQFVQTYPNYAIEAHLMSLTGPKLAECLTGATDPIRLLFGSPAASKVLEEYYYSSPMLSTMTSQLVSMITGSLQSSERNATLRILEVGAGTGGTTAALVASLATLDINVEYTFTDVSSSMITKAKKRFSRYHWMSFEKLDLEQAMPTHLLGKFDIVIGTNCVHATRDKVATTRRIRTVLNEQGFMVLSEVTRIIDWYDLVFGLLEGWWLSNGGFSYPLQSPDLWMKEFENAGFSSSLYSRSGSEDANTQHLLVGANQILHNYQASMPAALPSNTLLESPERTTVVYKEVEGVRIEADIYFPTSVPAEAMPIALMLHGGGHMTLSKRAIRPAQTAYLLSNGVLPMSLDYRLCPEINVVDGAMRDVQDAFLWVRKRLPQIAADRGIKLDTDKIVVIGWSTGGHLAMSTAWTVKEAGGTPPKAILCFYAPTDFLSQGAFPRRSASRIAHRMSRDQIMEIDVSGPPITNYDMQGVEDAELGWVKSGDARSELLLSIFREPREYGVSLMLNGTPGMYKTLRDLLKNEPSREKQTSMCPTAHLQAEEYNVPTFIVHGENDDIASFESALRFHEELKRQGIETGFIAVERGSHIHDLRLRPGMIRWDEQVVPGYKFLLDKL